MSVIDDKRLNEMINGMKPFAVMPWGIKFNEFSAKDLYSAMVELRELRAAKQWVPVAERLPKRGQICDIFAQFDNGNFRVCEVTFTSKAKGFDYGVFPLERVFNWRLSEHDRPPLPGVSE